VPLRLLHPIWCAQGPGRVDVDEPDAKDVVHRGMQTRWRAGEAVLPLNKVRYDLLTRFTGSQRHKLNGRGGSPPEPGSERVDLTITDTTARGDGGSVIMVTAHCLGIEDLRLLHAHIGQQLDLLKSESLCPTKHDYPLEDLPS
jgi:hypothetical protein